MFSQRMHSFSWIISFAVIGACFTGSADAVDGIAISTHTNGPGDGLGVNRSTFGDLVRHDIKDGLVVKSTVIFAGEARGACINNAGDKVAFIKLYGPVCVMNIDGTGVKELTNTKNHLTSAMDWPVGDWVFYSEQGSPTYKEDPPPRKTIRRVNVVTGEDELVGMSQYPIWQLTLASLTTKDSGRFLVTSKLLDFSNPQPWRNPGRLNCGSVVSPSGRYVSEMGHTHADLHIRSWDAELPNSPRNMLRTFHVNEWDPVPNDGRKYFYRPRWSVNSDKWIVITHGNNFSASTQRNMAIYNWIDGQQIQVTTNRGAAGDEGEDFWVAGIASDFVAGGLEGEAPFTVDLTSKRLEGREWLWNYGDGTEQTAPAGKHTYKKAGQYRVTATSGERVLRQTVRVLPRKAPRATVSVMDSSHLVVEFDEPIKADDAEVSLTSGTAVEGLMLGPLQRKLHITLEAAIQPADTLLLSGVFDLAQVPNPVANPKIPIKRPPWPSNRDGLVFLWETNKAPNVYLEPVSETFQSVTLVTKGSVRFDRDGVMVLGGGVFCAPNAGYGAVSWSKLTDELTIEATITPANALQGHTGNPSRVLVCRADHYLAWDQGFFALHQEGNKLVLYLSNRSQRFELCTMVGQVPNHVMVSIAAGKLACYLNGEQVFQTEKVKELNWRKNGYCAGVHFGGFLMVPGRHTPWQGKVEGVAVFCNAMSAEDAAADFAAYRKIVDSRKKVPQIKLQARLLAKSKIPRPADIRPYRDALVVNEYEVIKLVGGEYAHKKVRVADWGLLDTKPARIAQVKIGSKANMVLEAFADHPQLEAQILRDTLEEDFDLDLYFDVTPRMASPPQLVRIAVKPREVWTPPGHKIQFTIANFDNYGNPIDGEVTWSVAPGGSINVGMGYGAGHAFYEARQPGKATIDANGLFSATAPGTVTIRATSVDNPKIVGKAVVGIGAYPGVNPSKGLSMRLGADNGGRRAFKGDIDRIRMYRRVLTPEEIADHAAGKGLEVKDDDLVADWTFDKLTNGSYPNAAAPTAAKLAAKVNGEVEHVQEAGGGYIRLAGKGHLEVPSDKVLDISKALTLEAWIRPKNGGTIAARQRVWMWGFYFSVRDGWMMIDGLRRGWSPLETGHKFDPEKWTHVVGMLGPGRLWQLWADGKLVKEYKPKPMIVNDGN